MDYKKEIEKLLNLLKENGVTRDQIEKDFAYGENYIDQMLSKGGNKKVLAALKVYCKAVLPKSIGPGGNENGHGTPVAAMVVSLNSIQRDLQTVINLQTLTRADVRAFGEYQVMKDARDDRAVRDEIMAQINRLVALNLGATAKEGSRAGEGT